MELCAALRDERQLVQHNLRPVNTRRAEPGIRADAWRDVPATLADVTENGTDFGDADPTYDDCSKGSTIAMEPSDKNVGDLLSEQGITWGWFQGGFAPTGDNRRQSSLWRLAQERRR